MRDGTPTERNARKWLNSAVLRIGDVCKCVCNHGLRGPAKGLTACRSDRDAFRGRWKIQGAEAHGTRQSCRGDQADADGLQRTEIPERSGIGVASESRVLADAKKGADVLKVA
jgi:hypothetical protein